MMIKKDTNYRPEKSFGVVFSVVFLAITLYHLGSSKSFPIWMLSVSAIFLCLAFLAPKMLTVPNKLWLKFGILLGSIITPIVMVFVYFLTVLPTGLIMRLLGKDLLNLKIDKNTKSYWIE